MFEPRTEYDIITDKIDIADFHKYPEDFVVRPPYQRKNVWGTGKQQALLDSLFRRYYIPRLVLREVRLGDKRVVREVVDGQQRITTVQRFFADELRLPDSLNGIEDGLGGKRYSELSAGVRRFVDRSLKYDADVIKTIDNPRDAEHQRVATEIFWRLQQGESLNFMEVAHARLSSPVRNFLVRRADDIAFDYEKYQPLDSNPDKHPFFHLIERSNERMQHLALLGRLLLIEKADGPTDIRDKTLGDLIDSTQHPGGVGDYTYENESEPAALLKTLGLIDDIFRKDPMVDEESGVRELRIEYFIISVYMLLRHFRKYYAVRPEHHPVIRQFIYDFHSRWRAHHEDDRDILAFSDSRQQSRNDLEIRDRIMRQLFFDYLVEKNGKRVTKLSITHNLSHAESQFDIGQAR